jgi:hypothetical protein
MLKVMVGSLMLVAVIGIVATRLHGRDIEIATPQHTYLRLQDELLAKP